MTEQSQRTNKAVLRKRILAALTAGPMSREALRAHLDTDAVVLGTCAGELERDGKLVITGGRIGLPGQLPAFQSDDDKFRQQSALLWRRRGILCFQVEDIPDPFLRERLAMLANELYGRRR
jgi:hypothetical protein